MQMQAKALTAVAARAYLKREGCNFFFFRNIVQSLFASFVRIYKMKLFLVGQGQPINFSFYINLFLRLLRCFVTVT